MLCYSTGSLPDAPLEDLIPLFRGTPFRGVELALTAAQLERAGDGAYWRDVRRRFEDAGLVFRNVHMGRPNLLGSEPHEPGLAHINSTARGKRLDALLAGMEVAHRLGAPHYTFTTGLLRSGSSLPWQEGRVLEAARRLVEESRGRLRVGTEQEPEQVIHSAAQLHWLCEALDGELGINFDVGHSHVLGEKIPAAIDTLAPWLYNIHLEDIAGRLHRHLLFGAGDVRFGAVFAALLQVGYTGDFTPDLYPFAHRHREAMAASTTFLRRYLGSTGPGS